MSLDFRAQQIQTNKVIASGSSGTSTGAQILVYSHLADKTSSPNQGQIDQSLFSTSAIGTDIFLYVSGGIGEKDVGGAQSISVFGGDLHISGNLTVDGTYPSGGGGGDNYFWSPSDPYIEASGSLYITGSFRALSLSASNGGEISGSLTQGGAGNIASGINSHAEGGKTTAQGFYSHAEGDTTVAFGDYSHAEGYQTLAYGINSHTEGLYTTGSGNNSHAEGGYTLASGIGSHAEGTGSLASGNYSHAEGYFTTASQAYAKSHGSNTFASGEGAHAEGKLTEAFGEYSHAEGLQTFASGNYSHAQGLFTTASNVGSHAEGGFSIASGEGAHAEGGLTLAFGTGSHAEGNTTTAAGDYSHAEGYYTIASGFYSHAEGEATIAAGYASHAEGAGTTASGSYSHAEGESTKAITEDSHAEGYENIAGLRTYDITATDPINGIFELNSSYGDISTIIDGYATGIDIYVKDSNTGNSYIYSYVTSSFDGISNTYVTGSDTYSVGFANINSGRLGIDGTTNPDFSDNDSGKSVHSEGAFNLAFAEYSHVEGSYNKALGAASHAEGAFNKTLGAVSHAEGWGTIALGIGSHAEGTGSLASGDYSHAEGLGTIASGSYQHVAGTYNLEGNDFSLFVIGDGTDALNRSDIVRVNSGSTPGTGIVEITGSLAVTNGFVIGVRQKQYIAPKSNVSDTVANVIGQFAWVPADYSGLTSVSVRAIMSTDGTANLTGSLQIYNLTSGSYLDLIDTPATSQYFEITSSTPTLITSSNLLTGITNFDNSSTSVYEIRVSGSSADEVIIGGVELIYI
jgi:hypothetical protein